MLTTFLNHVYFHNQVKDYLVAGFSFAGYVLLIHLAKYVVIARVKKLTEKTASTLDDFLVGHVEKTLLPLLYFAAFWASVTPLNLPAGVDKAVSVLGLILLTFFATRFVFSVLDYILQTRLVTAGDSSTRARSLKGIGTVIKVLIAGIAALAFMDNLGIKISTLVAGLGIGGIAVAFALQAVLGDLFNYFVILFDRPFEHGDFIVVGEYQGTVETIGIKTTRLRSLSGEQLIFSNTFLTGAQVRNYKRMEQRRIAFKLGVTYQTTHEQLASIPGMLAATIKSVPGTVFDRAHFASYGDSALQFEAVYFVLSSDFNRYMDIQQAINLSIKQEFEKSGIEFAYPTRTVFVTQTPASGTVKPVLS